MWQRRSPINPRFETIAAQVVPLSLVGTPNLQAHSRLDFLSVATTTNAGAVTVDFHAGPPPNHASVVTGSFIVVDRTAQIAFGARKIAVGRFFGGALAIAGQLLDGGVGDAALNTSTVVFGVSGTNTITLTFNPPGGYAGTLDWVAECLVLSD